MRIAGPVVRAGYILDFHGSDAMARKGSESRRRSSKGLLPQIVSNRHCYVWLLPFIILFLWLQLYPAIYGFIISFTDYDGLISMDFVGTGNYVKAFKDPLFYQSLGNTFILWLLIVPARTFLALMLAVLLNNRRLIGSRIYRSIVLLPYITASAIVAIVFRILLTTDGGLVNVILGMDIGWLTTTELSKVSIAIMNIWRMTGYFSLVLLAGMQKIPSSVDEAAQLDGCGPVRKFFCITIPLMASELFFVVLISTIWIFQNVSDVMVLTNGGPVNSSTTLVYYVYQNAFEYAKMGYSSALSYILFAMLLVFSFFLVKFYYGRQEEVK